MSINRKGHRNVPRRQVSLQQEDVVNGLYINRPSY